MTLKWLSSYAPVDEEFDKVSLLLHGDGTNGSTTIVDSSSSPKAVTAVGDAQISTAQSKFGGSSIAFDGNGDALRIFSDAKFGFGTGDFTVEFWLYYLGGNGYVFFWIQAINTPTAPYLGYGLNTNSKNPWLWNNADVLTTATAISNNTWQHHAVVRNNGTLSIYLDGTAIGSTTFTADLGSSKPLSIGDNGNSTQFTNGYIDDFRITKGVARYTSNFTPPTAPLPDLSPNGRVTIEDNSLDVDARQYIINVEEQDGQPLESGVRTAINDFVVDCKADGIWNAIKASCILAGARTLDGALVPLTGGAPTNNNFVSADYDRETGLVGDGSTKYLDSNGTAATLTQQNSAHIAVYLSSTTGDTSLAGLIDTATSGGWLWLRGDINYAINNTPTVTSTLAGLGLVGGSRSNNSTITTRARSISNTVSATSSPASNLNVCIFAINQNNSIVDYSSSRLAFYSIGESLDLAKLDTRVSNLITAIGAAIP